MAVYDRWHTKKAKPGQQACREHSRGSVALYPSTDHGKGDRWQVRYRDDEGKQRKVNLPKKEGKDPAVHADALDKQIQGQLQARTYTDPDAGKVPLEVYAKQWLDAQTSDLSTRETQERWYRLRIQGTALGGREMAFLARRPSLVQQWVKGLEAEGLAPRSIKWALDMLATVFNAASDDEIVTRNPCHAKSVKAPATPESKVIPLTFEQVQNARDAMPPRFQAMIDLGYGAGMRQGEMFGLAVDDVDFLGKQEIRVLRQVKIVNNKLIFALPKGGKTRSVPIDDDLLLALSAHIRAFPPLAVSLPWGRPDGPHKTFQLLFSWQGPRYQGACRRDLVNPKWAAARARAGIPVADETGMHVLRHTAASAWLAGGVDIRALAAWLGHSDPAFTLRTYAHLMPSAPDGGRKAMRSFRATKIDSVSAQNVP